jgi:hypothetical protein
MNLVHYQCLYLSYTSKYNGRDVYIRINCKVRFYTAVGRNKQRIVKVECKTRKLFQISFMAYLTKVLVAKKKKEQSCCGLHLYGVLTFAGRG